MNFILFYVTLGLSDNLTETRIVKNSIENVLHETSYYMNNIPSTSTYQRTVISNCRLSNLVGLVCWLKVILPKLGVIKFVPLQVVVLWGIPVCVWGFNVKESLQVRRIFVTDV